ncbi:MAG: 16S rRNA (adenine(1518)-N(6)/adenine(1519)-N(6))-dimethyltransferase RsmA [Defluviitaleaceae bacterium]|nr:16S rRNA (adenine(1518)-N(6)/adenine(1519)-N(6))-dimethyltransferase RsmA [Defluviitaleaceae bacterium]
MTEKIFNENFSAGTEALRIATNAGAREIIERYGLNTKKRLGQHFLVDPRVVKKITDAAQISGDDCVLEIGPGIGGLTQALAETAGRVCAVESDASLVPVLRGIFGLHKNVTVIHGDALKINICECLRQTGCSRFKAAANLPYGIQSEIMARLLEAGNFFESVTVMMQRDAAERMFALPGTDGYGIPALAARYRADGGIAAYVPPNCFMPRPRVESAVICLKMLPEPRVAADETTLFKIIKAAFSSRRKTLVNCLFNAEIFPPVTDKEQIANVLRSCGIAPEARGESLSLEQFSSLAENFFTAVNTI